MSTIPAAKEGGDAGQAEPTDPLETITATAVRHGLLRPGEELPSNMLEFAVDLISQAAAVGDGYGDPEMGGNAGEHIRAVLYPF